ncbi:MAG: hypothetical protein HUU29_11500 [Planctomycetaceae bacterium]|nr:hypothetical protein [Planctomycetaceae bacterium]
MKVRCHVCNRKIKAKRKVIEMSVRCKSCGATPWQYDVLEDDSCAQTLIEPVRVYDTSSKPTLFVQSSNLTPYPTPTAPQPPVPTPAGYYPQQQGSSYQSPVPGYGMPPGYAPAPQGRPAHQTGFAAPVPQTSQPARAQRPARRATALTRKKNNAPAIAVVSVVGVLVVGGVIFAISRSNKGETVTASAPTAPTKQAPIAEPEPDVPEKPVVKKEPEKPVEPVLDPSVKKFAEFKEQIAPVLTELTNSKARIDESMKAAISKLKQVEDSIASDVKKLDDALKQADSKAATAAEAHKQAVAAKDAATAAYNAEMEKFATPVIKVYLAYEEFRSIAQTYDELAEVASKALTDFSKIDGEYRKLEGSIAEMTVKLEEAEDQAEDAAELQDKLNARAAVDKLKKQIDDATERMTILKGDYHKLKLAADSAQKDADAEKPKAKAARDTFDEVCLDMHGKDADAAKFIDQFAALEKAKSSLREAQEKLAVAKAWKDCLSATREQVLMILGEPKEKRGVSSAGVACEMLVYIVDGESRGVCIGPDEETVGGFYVRNGNSWEAIDAKAIFAKEFADASASVKKFETQPASTEKAFKTTVDKTKAATDKARKEFDTKLAALKADIDAKDQAMEAAYPLMMSTREAAATAKKAFAERQDEQKSVNKVQQALALKSPTSVVSALVEKLQKIAEVPEVGRGMIEDASLAATNAYGMYSKTKVVMDIPGATDALQTLQSEIDTANKHCEKVIEMAAKAMR